MPGWLRAACGPGLRSATSSRWRTRRADRTGVRGPPGPERRRLLARQFRVRLAPPAADKSAVRTLDDGPAAQQGGVKPPAPAAGRL